MQYITTTNLRTQTPKLVKALEKGDSISLIHRSKVIGVFQPKKQYEAPPINVEEFRKFIKSIKPKKLIPREKRDEIYRKHLMEKYGKNIS